MLRYHKCTNCKGKGKVSWHYKGKKKLHWYICQTCDGEGKVRKRK